MNTKKPVLLIIYDGWGVAQPTHGNAITQAKKPFFDAATTIYPTATLQASGEVVGLVWGDMGNSEVGHLTMGSGRIIYQSLARINKNIIDGNFFLNQAFIDCENHIKKNNSSLHLVGLVSNGGVHSHQDHLYALLDFCKKKSIKNVFIHAVLDGRDTIKDGGLDFIKSLQAKIQELDVGAIATICGRFYAMDRDNHWERIEKAYNAMVEGKSEYTAKDSLEAIALSYSKGVYDEELHPTVITNNGTPLKTIQENDAVIFFNFRPDRARQLTQAFTLPGFEKFSKKKYLKNLLFVSFTQYDKSFPVEIAFPPIPTNKTLAEILSENGLAQLHIAETEKYAHITYFFNGGIESPFKNEDRVLVASPLVMSYDEKPEMSAYEITQRCLKEIAANKYDFIVVNFANADMVGHTGNLEATIKAVQVIDECTEKLVQSILSKDGVVLITADHGNAEEMINLQSGETMKEHTNNPIPFMLISKQWEGKEFDLTQKLPPQELHTIKPSGMLADIAPTILTILNISVPKEMMGKSFISPN